MRVPLRKTVNIDSIVDPDKLGPIEKVKVAFFRSIKELPMYIRKKEREAEAAHKAHIALIDTIKEEILTPAYAELIANRRLGAEGLKCDKIQLAVSRSVEKDLRELLKHKEFVSFNIKFLEPNRDMLRSYGFKVLIEVSRRTLGGEPE